ncbi:Crp/Fnr family transcriptional regulator [Paenibacillus doosanensis]|uniref:Anaerobic regulatory protein n=1 Tax=Paenibacillus konkukensis TaxID=2020716 RepID=A0ABY4RZR8_9BACL|nr:MULTISPECIES: Crp/Fnr family transcriptional regulator [Paenibacillus]MCS7459361.1 Crp/Fnr family transcriptional regulator [Paenibacillus doosanensis]UQZ87154.1 Anaerobic regulatory protein [Paenibacillus konkukensis]
MTREIHRHAQIAAYLSETNFSLMERKMTTESKETGMHLFWEGDPAANCYYIKKGGLKIYKITEDGQELILHLLQAGDFYTEFGAVDARFSYNAEVTADSVIGVIPATALEELISSRGDFAIEFMKWMGLMHRTTQSKFRDLMLFGKSGAIASTLIRMGNTYGEPCESGIRLQVKFTKTELAHMIGTTREGVSRTLSAYQDRGAIAYEDGYLIIRDLAYLRSIVQCPDCPPDICRM